jgi:hypothetical protein
MKLKDDFESVVEDFISNTVERKSVVNNLMFYARKHYKAIFVSGVIAGIFLTIVLLEWFA